MGHAHEKHSDERPCHGKWIETKKNLLAFANALAISLLPWLQSFVDGRSRWRRAGSH
jgi:hypothetical protein